LHQPFLLIDDHFHDVGMQIRGAIPRRQEMNFLIPRATQRLVIAALQLVVAAGDDEVHLLENGVGQLGVARNHDAEFRVPPIELAVPQLPQGVAREGADGQLRPAFLNEAD